MKFPLIINPFDKIVINYNLIDKKANDLFLKRFQIQYRLNRDIPRYIHYNPPEKPKFEFAKLFDTIEFDFSTIIWFIGFFWLAIPILLILSFAEYINDLYKYKKLLTNYKSKRSSIITNNIKYEEYIRNELIEFENYKILNKVEYTKHIELFRKVAYEKKINEFTENICPPTTIESSPRKGITENYFMHNLIKYFDFIELDILSDYRIGYYFPDIILRTYDNVIVDIEIDEPYTWDTKEVIHYYDPVEGFYSDEFRNKAFEEMRWIVIRFTEEMIVSQTQSCCYEIALVLSKILKIDIPKEKVHPEIVKERLWSKRWGAVLASMDYRKKYIPSRIISEFYNGYTQI